MCKVNFALASALTVLTLAGCGGDDDPAALTGETAPSIVQPGAPGEPTKTLSPGELEALKPSAHTPVDVRFMQGMIQHHAQALRMTALVPARSTSPDVDLLARRIDLSQESEIDLMRTWLERRGEEAPSLQLSHGQAHGAGQALLPGMLTEAQLRQLEAAKGQAFDRLFLRSMIRHHEGALRMVHDLYARAGGLEPEADAFARHVDADQQIEIARMQQLLTNPS